jgi:copper chaperone
LNLVNRKMAEASTTYVYNVGMTCDGCKGAVTRILNKVEGISSFDANVAEKKVTIVGNINPDDVLAKLKKWGDASGKVVEYVGTAQ